MRVVTGRWHGRKLFSPAGKAVRPTTDRVKEAMFSILGSEVNGSLFLDLCCGSGALAVEALSRGADQALLVDVNGRALDCARRNLELCGAATNSYELVKAKAEVFFARWKSSHRDSPWILVCDPPYHSGLSSTILSELCRGNPPTGFRAAVFEHGPGESFVEPSGEYWSLDQRQYGETGLTIVRPS